MIKFFTKHHVFFLYCLVILEISYVTYFRNYWYPQALFWDEIYHVTTTFKYLNHVMFMTGDPPLGKLLIALGEYIFHPNTNINMQYALSAASTVSQVPKDFSFVGIRFIPVLLGTLSSVLFFSILCKISGNKHISFLFTSLYLFDNALILQSRGALLDSIQIFFVLASILTFLLVLDHKKITAKNYLLLGVLIGCIVAIRLTGLVFLIMLPFLLFYEKAYNGQKLVFMSIIGKSALFLAGILLIFFGSYYVHAKIVNHVVANRYYHASSSYKKILDTKKLFQVQNFPLILKDYLYFIPSFESSIKSNDANSSRPYSWPFENKSINYRWAADHGATRYLYFLGNPLIWFAGLVGIILGFSLVIAVLFFKLPVQLKDKKLFFTIAFLLSLYAGFMASLMMVRRVVYLYHYLVPLVISLLIAFTIFYYLKQNALARNEKNVYLWVGFFVIGIIAVYYFFSPLTYYQPLTKDAFFWRNWFSFWHLQPF